MNYFDFFSTESVTYPVELLAQCREAPLGIVRLSDGENNPQEGGQTLLETLQQAYIQGRTECMVHTPMDVCHILSFTFDKATSCAAVESEINLLKPSPHISLGGILVDTKARRILKRIPAKEERNQAICRLSYECKFDQSVDANALALLVSADWQAGSIENHLVLERDYAEATEDLQYEHMQPDKESEAVEIIVDKNYERFSPSGRIYKGDEEYIVMCFIREPYNKDDVDYILRVKRGAHNNPMFAAPGKGQIWMEDAKLCWDKGVTATCVVTKVGGGGGAGAVYHVDYPSETFMEYGKGMMYLMHLSWNQEYMEPGDMRPQYFDYHLVIDAEFQSETGRTANVRTQVIVSSKDIVVGSHTAYKKIPKLEILWGCLAEGTLITMSDNTQKPIEDIRIGESVLGADRSAWSVRNVWRGVEYEPLLRFCCRTGESVLATKYHVMLTDAGLMPAESVTVDMRLAGLDGWLEIERIEEERYGGTVYNLDIDKEDARPAREHLMVAGGIIVGDNKLQNTPLGR